MGSYLFVHVGLSSTIALQCDACTLPAPSRSASLLVPCPPTRLGESVLQPGVCLLAALGREAVPKVTVDSLEQLAGKHILGYSMGMGAAVLPLDNRRMRAIQALPGKNRLHAVGAVRGL